MIDRILIADDEYLARQFLEEVVSRHAVEVLSAASGEEAIDLLQNNDCQMAFVDVKMGKTGGMDVLRFARAHCPHLALVLITAYGTVETAVEAMRTGAFDFVIKPFTPDQVDVLIEKARQWLSLNEQHHYLKNELSGVAPGGESEEHRIVGASPQMRALMRLVRRVAPTDATVLISGESGTGKELVAHEIHRLSDPEENKPYIRMNCAAVPESLLESELFGHEKGAFTGAQERRIGRFELADGGTLLLDEIGEISMAMQSKLLRVLQESEFERVGGSKTIKVAVRVLATTNRDLAREVAEGNFREDLFYRLNVFPLQLPALRGRDGDTIEIADVFLAQQARKLRRPLEFGGETRECLRRYSWPGNIRELENVIERVAILEDGPVIGPESLPLEIRLPNAKPLHQVEMEEAEGFDLREIERRTIFRALRETIGNRSEAASLLGFSVRTLRNKLNEYRDNGEMNDATLKAITNSGNGVF